MIPLSDMNIPSYLMKEWDLWPNCPQCLISSQKHPRQTEKQHAARNIWNFAFRCRPMISVHVYILSVGNRFLILGLICLCLKVFERYLETYHVRKCWSGQLHAVQQLLTTESSYLKRTLCFTAIRQCRSPFRFQTRQDLSRNLAGINVNPKETSVENFLVFAPNGWSPKPRRSAKARNHTLWISFCQCSSAFRRASEWRRAHVQGADLSRNPAMSVDKNALTHCTWRTTLTSCEECVSSLKRTLFHLTKTFQERDHTKAMNALWAICRILWDTTIRKNLENTQQQ